MGQRADMGGSIRYVVQTARGAVETNGHATERVIAAGGGLLAMIWAMDTAEVLFLLAIAAVVAVAVDLVAGAAAAIRDPDREYDRAKLYAGLWGKLLRFCLVIAALLLDVVIVGAARLFMIIGAPGASVAWEMWSQTVPLFAGALAWLVVAEAFSIFQAGSETLGASAVFPPARLAIDWIRSFVMRGRPPEYKRWSDDPEAERRADEIMRDDGK